MPSDPLCFSSVCRPGKCALWSEFRLLDGCNGTPASSVMAEVRPSSEEKSVGRLQKQPTCGATGLGLAQFSPLALRAEHGLIVSALLDKFWTLIDPTLSLTSEDTDTSEASLALMIWKYL